MVILFILMYPASVPTIDSMIGSGVRFRPRKGMKGPPKFISFLPKKGAIVLLDVHAQNHPLLCIHKGLAAFVPFVDLWKEVIASDDRLGILQFSIFSRRFTEWFKGSEVQPTLPTLPTHPRTTPRPPKPNFTTAANNLGPGLCKALVTCYVRTSSADAPCMWLPSRRIRRSRGAAGGKRFDGSDGGWMVVGSRISSAKIYSKHL